MYRENFYVNLNTMEERTNLFYIWISNYFTLSDVRWDRSSICCIEFPLASNDCKVWQEFNIAILWILLFEIFNIIRFCKVLRPYNKKEEENLFSNNFFFVYNQLNQLNYMIN